jgi:TctA family transporter
MLEQTLRQALIISNGDPAILVSGGICQALTAMIVLSFALSILKPLKALLGFGPAPRDAGGDDE